MRFLLAEAQHSPSFYEGISLQRGQLFRGRTGLNYETGLSDQTIKSSISNLRKLGEVTIEVTNRGTVYTLVNYDIYDATKEKVTNEVTSKSPTNQPASNQQVTTYNEEERTKEVKEDMQIQIQDHKIAPQSNPVSDLGDIVVGMGLPAQPATYSWIGGLHTRFGPACRTFLEAQQLKGATVDDFQGGPKGFKAYFTAAISKLAAENGKAAQIAAKPHYTISNVDGGFEARMKSREKWMHELIRDYTGYADMQQDPDKGKPGAGVTVSDERAKEIWEQATKERQEREQSRREAVK